MPAQSGIGHHFKCQGDYNMYKFGLSLSLLAIPVFISGCATPCCYQPVQQVAYQAAIPVVPAVVPATMMVPASPACGSGACGIRGAVGPGCNYGTQYYYYQ